MSIAGKGKSSEKAKAEPSKVEMHRVAVDILKEVDFNKVSNVFLCHFMYLFCFFNIVQFFFFVFSFMQATLSDILRQLGMTRST